MAGTYEGLGVPLFGPYYRYSANRTENLSVSDAGVTALTVAYTGIAASKAFTVNYSVSGSDIASGYGAGVHVNLGIDGSSTGAFASYQQNAFSPDVTINGTPTGGIGGLYVYISKGTATLTSAVVYGGYFDIGNELGATDYLSCVTLDKHNTTVGTTVDAFILCQLQGSGTGTTMIHMQGPAHPTYFLSFNSIAGTGCVDATGSRTMTEVASIAVNIAGTKMLIPLIDAT